MKTLVEEAQQLVRNTFLAFLVNPTMENYYTLSIDLEAKTNILSVADKEAWLVARFGVKSFVMLGSVLLTRNEFDELTYRFALKSNHPDALTITYQDFITSGNTVMADKVLDEIGLRKPFAIN